MSFSSFLFPTASSLWISDHIVVRYLPFQSGLFLVIDLPFWFIKLRENIRISVSAAITKNYTYQYSDILRLSTPKEWLREALTFFVSLFEAPPEEKAEDRFWLNIRLCRPDLKCHQIQYSKSGETLQPCSLSCDDAALSFWYTSVIAAPVGIMFFRLPINAWGSLSHYEVLSTVTTSLFVNGCTGYPILPVEDC